MSESTPLPQNPVSTGEKREREEPVADQQQSQQQSAASPASVPPASTPAEAPQSQAPKKILRLKSANKTPLAASPAISTPSVSAPVRRLSSGSPLLGLANITVGTAAQNSPASPTSTLSRSSTNLSFSSSGAPKELRFAPSLFRALESDATRMEIDLEYLQELTNTISTAIASETDASSTMQTLYPFLKEPANIALRENVIKGVVPPERLVRMSETELMTPEAQEKERAAASRRLMDRDQEQLSKAKAMNSKMFKCGKCHQRDASYYEKQTRSADEPMTLFITCNKCNHLWRIG